MSRAPVLVVPELTTPQATGWPTHSGRSAEPPRAQNRSRGAAARPGRCRRFLRRFHMQVRRVSAKRRTPALSCRTAPATPRWPRTRQRWRATLPPRSSVTRSTPRACRSSASRQCLASVLRATLLGPPAGGTACRPRPPGTHSSGPRRLHAHRWGAPAAASTGPHGAASRLPPVIRGRPCRGFRHAGRRTPRT